MSSYLEENPACYELGLKNKLFNMKKFWSWIFMGGWHACIIIYISVASTEINFSDIYGHTSSIFVTGMMAFTEAVLIANLIIINFSNTFHPFSLAINFLSVAFYVSNVYIANNFESFDSFGVFIKFYL